MSRNITERQVLLRKFSMYQIFRNLETQIIHESKKGNRLYEASGPQDYFKMLRCTCPSTNKTYYKFLPDHFVDTDAAMAHSFGLTLGEYLNIEKET